MKALALLFMFGVMSSLGTPTTTEVLNTMESHEEAAKQLLVNQIDYVGHNTFVRFHEHDTIAVLVEGSFLVPLYSEVTTEQLKGDLYLVCGSLKARVLNIYLIKK
jgi:hypothetical protein